MRKRKRAIQQLDIAIEELTGDDIDIDEAVDILIYSLEDIDSVSRDERNVMLVNEAIDYLKEDDDIAVALGKISTVKNRIET